MRRNWITGLVAAALCVLTVTSVLAGGTKLISYQGRVTRADGSVVADGTYPATFSFYAASTDGAPLWTESSPVTTTGGLFTHILGSIVPIADTLFPANGEVWLEVIFNGQQQTPRTQFLAASYALRVNTVDGAQGGTVTDSIVITPRMSLLRAPTGTATTDSKTTIGFSNTSPVMSFYEPLDSKIAGTAISYKRSEIGSKGLRLLETGGAVHTFLGPDSNGSGGYLCIGNPNASLSNRFVVDGNYMGSGNPYLALEGDKSSMILNPSAVGTNTVQLPSSAIDASEIMNEPGIAQGHYYSTVSLSGANMRTLDSVIISTPSDGYVVIDGFCSVRRSGTTGLNYTYFQIDTVSGGPANWPDYTVVGSYQQLASTDQYQSAAVTKTYYLAAGTYKFLFEGMGDPSNSSGWSAAASYPTIRATFFPTSYGAVQSVVSQGEGSAYTDKVAVVPQAVGASMTAGPAAYLVDLRELELKAAKAEAEAQKARAALAEAALKQQLAHRQSATSDK